MKYCVKKGTYFTKKLIASKIAKPRNPRYLLRTAHFPMSNKVKEIFSYQSTQK